MVVNAFFLIDGTEVETLARDAQFLGIEAEEHGEAVDRCSHILINTLVTKSKPS